MLVHAQISKYIHARILHAFSHTHTFPAFKELTNWMGVGGQTLAQLSIVHLFLQRL